MPRRVVILSLIAALLALPASPSIGGVSGISPEEQWFVYDLNRARSDPGSYAAEHGITILDGAGNAITTPMPPLAPNDALFDAAGTRAGHMVAFGYGHHCPYDPPGPQGPTYEYCPNRVARLAGYDLPTWWSDDANSIEVIWAGGPTGTPSPSVFLQYPSHAEVLLVWGDRTEIGTGRAASATASYFAAHVALRDAADPGQTFITGVVFDDTNANCLMDLSSPASGQFTSEGLGGITVSIPGTSVTTNAGGGYSIPVSDNATYQVTVTGPGVSATATAVVGSDNVGLDFIKGETTAIPPGCVERWWGSNRYGTAAAVSKATHPGGAEVVYLASGSNHPDALAAGPAAAAEGAPILLVQKTVIPPETGAELQRLNPSTVVILGGTAAIAESVAQQATGLVPGAVVDRRWGATRYETAADISERAFPQGADTVFVATGTDFPDALVAAPGAVASGAPLLLVPSNGIPAQVRAELDRLGPKKIEVIGSPTVIPDTLLDDLAGYAAQGASRTYGPNRHATSVAVSQLAFPTTDTVFIAVGTKFPDALAGGAGTGVITGPILLVEENAIPGEVAAELNRLGPGRIVVLGGPAAVSSLVASQLTAFVD